MKDTLPCEALALAFKRLYYNSERGWFSDSEITYHKIYQAESVDAALLTLRSFWRGY